jgi:lipopolysaccharide export system protein LptA
LALGGLGWGAWYLATHPTWGAPAPLQAPPALAVRAGSLTIRGWQQHGGTADRLWQVTAHDVRASADGHIQWFRQITDGILYHDGQPVARFSAGQGQGDESQNILSISGGAHMRLEGDGTAVDTEEVRWQGPQRQLWLPRPILLTRAGLRLQGNNAHLDEQRGRLTSEFVSGRSRLFGFHARHAVLLLKERRLELNPVALDLPSGQGHARRVVYFADEGRFQAQEVQMHFMIMPTAMRSAAATGLTLALLTAAHGTPAPEKKLQAVEVTGDTLSNDDRQMVLDHAIIRQKDTTFTADHMVIEKDPAGHPEKVTATGNPRGWNERDEVTGDKMTVYPKERRAVVEGHFRAVVKPQPGDEPSEDPSDLRGQVKDGVMTGDHLDYDYRNKNVAAQGNLKMTSRGRVATGERLFYTDSTEIVQFFGPVHAHDEKSQTFDTAAGLTLSLNKKGISHVPGKFKAVLYVPDDEEPAIPTGADGKPQKSTAPPQDKSQKAAEAPKPPPAPEQQASGEKKSP